MSEQTRKESETVTQMAARIYEPAQLNRRPMTPWPRSCARASWPSSGSRSTRRCVQWACKKASYHKAWDTIHGCAEHFTAWQVLDLYAAHEDACSFCKQVAPPLHMHHRIALRKGGPNTIDNIELLCSACHEALELFPDEISERWMASQTRLLGRIGRYQVRASGSRSPGSVRY